MKNTGLLVALGAALSLAVSACGSDDSDSASAAPGNGADRAFVAAMIPHHESAVQMAEIAQTRGQSTFSRTWPMTSCVRRPLRSRRCASRTPSWPERASRVVISG